MISVLTALSMLLIGTVAFAGESSSDLPVINIVSKDLQANGMPVKFPAPPNQKAKVVESGKKAKKENDSLPTSVSLPPMPIEGPNATGNYRLLADFPNIVERENPVSIPPEITTYVNLSVRDINRITCAQGVKSITTSDEKPVTISYAGKEGFIKLEPLQRDDGQMFYPTDEIELYVKCGEETYQLIGVPRPVHTQIIRLGSRTLDKVKQNQSIYGSMPHETKLNELTRQVLKDQIPETTTTREINKKVEGYKELDITLKKIIEVDGEGLVIKDYILRLKDPSLSKFETAETMFLRNDIVSKPLLISVHPPVLTHGSTSHLIIIEHNGEGAK